jgi:hypothetical protein
MEDLKIKTKGILDRDLKEQLCLCLWLTELSGRLNC